MALVASSLALILLGGIYAFATDVNSTQRIVVEFVMLGSMVLAVIFAIVYLSWTCTRLARTCVCPSASPRPVSPRPAGVELASEARTRAEHRVQRRRRQGQRVLLHPVTR